METEHQGAIFVQKQVHGFLEKQKNLLEKQGKLDTKLLEKLHIA